MCAKPVLLKMAKKFPNLAKTTFLNCMCSSSVKCYL